MKRFILFLVFLFFSVVAGLRIQEDPGYALFVYKNWTVEMPLWLVILFLVSSFVLIYSLLRFISNTSSVGRRLQNWLWRRRSRLSRNLTSRGLIELAEGHWDIAEKNLIRVAEGSETPIVNYLAAARAAQEQGAYERRDDYLRLAHDTTPNAEIAVGVVQAELQLSHQQFEHALATLNHLRELAPSHVYVLGLLKQAYLSLQDFAGLAELLPTLRKYKVISAQQFEDLQLQVYQELLKPVAQHMDVDTLQQFWQQVPREVQRKLPFLRMYVICLIEKKAGSEAELLLRDTLKKTWDDPLVQYYGLAEGSDPTRQLATAESWLKTHGNSAMLLLTLGRLCIRNQLWGKARSYLESSVQLLPHPEAYRELGKLLSQLGETEAAFQAYEQGLLVATRTKGDYLR